MQVRVHESMSDLHEIGLIDKTTMREFDASCLTPVEPLLPKDVLALLTREGVNQAVMARHLYVAEDPVANGSAAKGARPGRR